MQLIREATSKRKIQQSEEKSIQRVISASKTASYYFGACESLADPSPSASGYQNKISSLLRSYRILTRTEI